MESCTPRCIRRPLAPSGLLQRRTGPTGDRLTPLVEIASSVIRPTKTPLTIPGHSTSSSPPPNEQRKYVRPFTHQFPACSYYSFRLNVANQKHLFLRFAHLCEYKTAYLVPGTVTSSEQQNSRTHLIFDTLRARDSPLRPNSRTATHRTYDSPEHAVDGIHHIFIALPFLSTAILHQSSYGCFLIRPSQPRRPRSRDSNFARSVSQNDLTRPKRPLLGVYFFFSSIDR